MRIRASKRCKPIMSHTSVEARDSSFGSPEERKDCCQVNPPHPGKAERSARISAAKEAWKTCVVAAEEAWEAAMRAADNAWDASAPEGDAHLEWEDAELEAANTWDNKVMEAELAWIRVVRASEEAMKAARKARKDGRCTPERRARHVTAMRNIESLAAKEKARVAGMRAAREARDEAREERRKATAE